MPRPRFEKLDKDKQSRILEAAAKEFSANGFENASLNQILDAAGISKGAAYYYFDDKADLYTTTLLHYMNEILNEIAFDVNHFTKENFWQEVAALYKQQFKLYFDRPWVFGIAKSGGPISMEMIENEPYASVWQSAQVLLIQLFQRGRELNVIRDDLPEDLLQSLLVSVDMAHDRWLFAHWAEFSAPDIDQAAQSIANLLERLLKPV